MAKEFFGEEGSLAFVIPFFFTTEDGNESNVCTRLFNKVKPDDDRDQYEEYKDELRNALSNRFPYVEVGFHGASGKCGKKRCYFDEECHGKTDSYKGRNLCPCLSVSRKFHDDASQNIPRIELCLGRYHVRYIVPNPEDIFEFYIDALLLLSNETGGEGGYLVFNISLDSVKGNCIENVTHNKLDNFIFIKHLFYKDRLKCSINNEHNISIKEWAGNVFRSLMTALEITCYGTDEGNTGGIAFRYSIMELNNIKEKDNPKDRPLLSKMKSFLNDYRNQVYGLMVSDEGWRYISDNEMKSKFENNHWSSRNFSTAFFLGHNALIITQSGETGNNDVEKGAENENTYTKFSEKWYGKYGPADDSNFYKVYARLRPCIPGVATRIFYAFLKAIYKEIVLERVEHLSDGNAFTDEEKFRRLAFALQQHSMSLDAIKSVEDSIYSQFEIPDKLKSLRDRYEQEANNVQNKKVVNLTHVTLAMSLAALIIATLALGIDNNGYSMFAAGMEWTFGALVFAWVITLLATLYIVNNALFERLRRRKKLF